jgi:hypothetical protein
MLVVVVGGYSMPLAAETSTRKFHGPQVRPFFSLGNYRSFVELSREATPFVDAMSMRI